MNTLENLITEYGLPEVSAKYMLECWKKHIGEMYGCNVVTDINYIGRDRDIELKCTKCGHVHHKIFTNSKNKWSEIRKTCPVCDRGTRSVPSRNDDPSYIGKVYGDFKVIAAHSEPKKYKSGGCVVWDCECVRCGEIALGAYPATVKAGKKKCLCCQEKEKAEKHKAAVEERKHRWDSEIGKKYGRLTVIGYERRQSGRHTQMYALCSCDCGGSVAASFTNLKHGGVKSCGCIAKEYVEKCRDGRPAARSRSPLYGTWHGMIDRCFNPKNNGYANYGGRGITVCEEWLGKEGFDRFEKWAYENGYEPECGLSLDRIDVNGNYEPSNCRYATVYIQTVNKRPAKKRPVKTYDIDGETHTFKQWCGLYHISDVSVKYRMEKLGMSLEEALKTPKTRKGNVFAGEQSRDRARKRTAELNKCESYIEANLYLAAIRKNLPLIPQHKVGNYHADFLVSGTNIIVECDGFDYHKTKEQIANDYARERFFVREGYAVIRFFGTEINTDPEACCDEISQIIEANYEQTWKANA